MCSVFVLPLFCAVGLPTSTGYTGLFKRTGQDLGGDCIGNCDKKKGLYEHVSNSEW